MTERQEVEALADVIAKEPHDPTCDGYSLCECTRERRLAEKWAASLRGVRMPGSLDPDYKVLAEELMRALAAALEEEKLPNGEYVHHLVCNGDRRHPAGSIGVSCCCLPTTRKLRHRVAELEAALGAPSSAPTEPST